MKKHTTLSFLLITCFTLFLSSTLFAQQLAFPGAEGFGRFTSGGRGGTVYHVTNLNDSGAGSFRDAVSQPNRYVVFDVGGVIILNSVVVVEDNITIAGMTAPGGGITIYKHRVAFNGNSGNDVVRYMRFRLGRNSGGKDDAMSISDNKDNYMFDHVSISWGRDGTFDINTDSENITLQDCIIGQGLQRDNHSTGSLIQGANLSISIIRSLYIDNKTRNPKIRGTHEFINSVIYNWQENGFIAGDTEGLSQCNMIGNYFIYGPSSAGSYFSRPTASFNIYADDNWVDNNKDGELNGTKVTSWGSATVVSEPFPYPGVVNTLSAEEAVYHVINNVGSSLTRDAVDEILIEELSSFGTKGAIIYGEEDLNLPGAVGNVEGGTKPTDTDNDGMPDYFEDLIGYDKNKSDYNEDADGDGYPNIEEYFNCLTCECDVKMEGCAGFRSGSYNLKIETNDLCVTDNENGSLVQSDCDGTGNQGWIFNEVEEGQFSIKSYGREAYLTYSNALEGTNVITSTSQSVAKLFKVVETEGIGYKIAVPDTDFFLAVKDGSSASGARLILTASPGSETDVFRISNYSPMVDCAGTVDGTAKIDDCGVCAGGESGVEACAGGIGGEEFCANGSVGVFEDTNGGYLGTGYFNFDNAVGTTASYKVYAKEAGAVEATFRFANGGGASRPCAISVGGTQQVASQDFPVTGSWTTWQEVKATLTFSKGTNDLVFTATTSDGGPNLDLIGFPVEGYYNINCDGTYTLDCFGVPDGDAYLDACNNCVAGNTGNEPCDIEVPMSNENLIGFNFYPNPFANTFTLKSDKALTYSIINLAGQTLQQGQTNNETFEVGQSLESGIYLLKIMTENGDQFVNRIVKSK